jgi:hypothetical protein
VTEPLALAIERAQELLRSANLEAREDLTMGEGGIRWVTVGAKDQPELPLTLMVPGPADHGPGVGRAAAPGQTPR